MNVTIVDYNSGNISSVINSFKEVAQNKVNIEVTSDLKKIKKIGENKFNLIFLDPPYKEKNISLLLNEINEMNILIEEGIIILHRHKRSNDSFDSKFKILRTENYGISKIIFGKFI